MSDYRARQVKKIVSVIRRQKTKGATRSELANHLGIAKSQYLYGLIADAIALGQIKALQPKDQHNRLLWVYVYTGRPDKGAS